MKISLRPQEGDVVTLDIDGSVNIQETQVLKAGLTKLLQSGKNKIILHFINSHELDNEVIREIAILDILAKELAGKIVIATEDGELRKVIHRFSKPPIMPTVASLDAAADLFKTKGSSDRIEIGAVEDPIIAKDREIHILKEKIKLGEATLVKKLQKENADLKTKIQFLEKNIVTELRKRRKAVEADGFMGKINALEIEVKTLSSQLVKEKK